MGEWRKVKLLSLSALSVSKCLKLFSVHYNWFELALYQMGFSRNRGLEGKDMRAESRSESQ